jgi:hypothetical protein
MTFLAPNGKHRQFTFINFSKRSIFGEEIKNPPYSLLFRISPLGGYKFAMLPLGAS